VHNNTIEEDLEFDAFAHYFKGSLATWLPITAVWYVIIKDVSCLEGLGLDV
jgi:hypothetical protein